MKWIKTSDKLPPVDKSNDWNKNNSITKDVWTFSEFGTHVGRYFHSAEMWTINNVTSSRGIKVSHWMNLPPIPKDNL